ncbi:hypothetical protein TIFTF001_032181 [Ficus carica]|uniref:Uncharacterized protein n=1 Tax=Ficus carica TaxID=3494 RepID=A0AA88E2Z5_FICCA|nr:hypothetical protein TIFTF001_032181 [Ficus carica]
MNNQGWENNSTTTTMEPWTDQRLAMKGALLKEILVVLRRILEVMVECLRDLKASTPTINISIKTIKDYHLEELTQRKEHFGVVS